MVHRDIVVYIIVERKKLMKYVKLFETLLEYALQNYVFRVDFIKILIKIYSSEIALRIIL